MAKVSRSDTSFQKVKYHSLVYNSSTMIRTNIFYFQKTCYMLELTCPSGSYDQENYLNVYSSLLKHPCSLTFPTFQYLQLTNNILCIFLNVTARPASGLQRKHTQDTENRQHKRRLCNASCHTTRTALKDGKKEMIRASNSG